ncbi:MAG TPA: 16S rRNA (adenine(1518)-N(6)/adenine(1519)-N(6))-dimethyltransferase RsmA [Gammaproteobacteria bacterium]|nr:16S rRNA (adenine(1518)-N(6)/adenine(1519)-N(6))-dimethyltransferase RsmA [Gammaproteobacteria bacterium]
MRASRKLGQHFLHDPAVIARIVREISPQQADVVVEIGGGRGALTRPLLERLDHLHVVETDSRLVPLLEALAPSDRLEVHRADALQFELDRLAPAPGTLRVVGNLPYNISTPLLFHFLRYRESLRDLHLMLQKEVADRIAAGPGSKRYGRLTVMLAAWTEIETVFDVGPGAFHPAPKVWSSFVRIVPHRRARFDIADQAAFARIVALAFSMRRKTLRRILKGRVSASEIEAAGFDPAARPETLAPEDFARLSQLTG